MNPPASKTEQQQERTSYITLGAIDSFEEFVMFCKSIEMHGFPWQDNFERAASRVYGWGKLSEEDYRKCLRHITKYPRRPERS